MGGLPGLRRVPAGLPAAVRAPGNRGCPSEGSVWAQKPQEGRRSARAVTTGAAERPHHSRHSLHHPTVTSAAASLRERLLPAVSCPLPAVSCPLHQHLPQVARQPYQGRLATVREAVQLQACFKKLRTLLQLSSRACVPALVTSGQSLPCPHPQRPPDLVHCPAAEPPATSRLSAFALAVSSSVVQCP